MKTCVSISRVRLRRTKKGFRACSLDWFCCVEMISDLSNHQEDGTIMLIP
ncbi:hypothetical protein F383_02052 [Gossypium arboreum]|uniref:Uncharacterized protein n=1 Tax=Gossypium arboreum TaxID=29729 RepID=A0A0B0N4U1_GOSAR|nr:hypothetical protein F383_06699 [Gossypium arboreum]KHG23231.1 hypothetical protein F383_02052 [Gossypium arboreum]